MACLFFNDRTAKVQQLIASKRSSAIQGSIRNGGRYVIYRVALYDDGFQTNKSTRQSQSFWGVYLLPVGLYRFERTSSQAVWVLCLTTHGFPIAWVLKYIIEDLVIAATEVTRGVDPDGRPIRIFTNMSAMMGDLPQASPFTDVLGHSANTLCMLYCMRKHKNHTFPETNYSSGQHSDRVSLVRFGARRKAIQACNLEKRTMQKLGMKMTLLSRDLPAVHFSSNLTSITSCPPVPDKDGNLTLDCPQLSSFDHTMSIPALPDHLISTMTGSVLKLCFKKFEPDRDRTFVKMRTVDSVLTDGLEVKRNILSWHSSMKGVQ